MACRKRRLLMGLDLFFSLISYLLVLLSIINACFQIPFFWPEERLGSSDVSPLSGISGLSFDSTFLSALLLFCLVLLLILSSHFLCFGPVSCLLSRNVFKLLFSRDLFVIVCIALVFRGWGC